MAETATSPPADTRPDSWETSTAMPADQTEEPSDSRHNSDQQNQDMNAEQSSRPTMQIHHDRRESVASSRPDVDAPPAKRQRTLGAEEKKRGQRLFGNLMGTLAKFGKEEKTRNSTEKAKKRDELAHRVAEKIRSESNRVHEITGLTREIRGYRMEIEKKQQEMNLREMLLKTKIRQLPKMSRFLLTDSPDWLTSTIASTTVMPISFGPARDKQTAEKPKPLFYVRVKAFARSTNLYPRVPQLPHKLLPTQDDLIDDQLDKVNKYLDDQEDEFDEYQAATKKEIAELEEKKSVAEEKLSKYRQADQDRAAERLGAAITDAPAEVKREDPHGDIDMQDVAKASGRPPVPEREEREESRAAGEEVEW